MSGSGVGYVSGKDVMARRPAGGIPRSGA
jgi:hypothetical protein